MNAATVVELRKRMAEHMFDDYDFDSFIPPEADSVGKGFTKVEKEMVGRLTLALANIIGDAQVPSYRVAPHVMGTMIEAGKALPHVSLQTNEPMTEYGCLFFDVPTEYGELDSLLPRKVIEGKGLEQVDCHGFVWADFGKQVVVSLLVRYPDVDDADYPVPGPMLTLARGRVVNEVSLGDGGARWARCIVALWRFLNQKLLTTVVDPVPRGMRRAAIRKAEDLPEVRIIQLRSTRPGDTQRGEELGRDWSHRWIVRGHWRQQWHPSTSEHQLAWIDPYIKGPQEKPLVIRPTVYEVTR